ncbi:hypothetical protein COMNV_00465 [Commensalibacter sp. Nvir]|uniref:HdeD family acid-resistance protein n=1 Tax=Commensalibacter sp. Nvir TaxID=3069817 RepID=UPI002D2C2EA8|nr:hypothetical protein COMNV_00465 [Commensalibacter sp. Nvir]
MNFLESKWKWFIALGVIFLLLGCLALIDTAIVTIASVILLGVVLTVAGLAQIIHAFYLKGWESFFISALAGIIYLVGGVLLISEPIAGSIALTLFIAICFFLGGISRIIIAMKQKNSGGFAILLLSGILSVALGIILFIEPTSGLWFIGFMIAIDLILIGMGWIHMGLFLKKKTL